LVPDKRHKTLVKYFDKFKNKYWDREYIIKSINKKLSDKTIYNILKALENLKRKNIDYKNISNNEIVKLKLNKSKAYAIKKFNEFKMVK